MPTIENPPPPAMIPIHAVRTLPQMWADYPVVVVHLTCAIGALLLGAVMLLRRKGTASHRSLGWLWVLLMGGAALTSAFISGGRLAILGPISPIHMLTLLVLVLLPRAVWQARQGLIEGHRRTMRGLYFGGCIVAGAFTLLPGRFLGQLLWKQALGVMS